VIQESRDKDREMSKMRGNFDKVSWLFSAFPNIKLKIRLNEGPCSDTNSNKLPSLLFLKTFDLPILPYISLQIEIPLN